MSKFWGPGQDLIDFIVSLLLLWVIFSPVTVVATISHAPVGTTLIVMFMTTFAFESVVTTALAYIGIVLFGASFPIGEHYGLVPALLVWATGIGIWIAGVYYGYKGGFRIPTKMLLA